MPYITLPSGTRYNLQEKALTKKTLLKRFLKTFQKARERSELTGEKILSELILEGSLERLTSNRKAE